MSYSQTYLERTFAQKRVLKKYILSRFACIQGEQPLNRINNNREKDATIRKLRKEVAKLTQEQQQQPQQTSSEWTPNTRRAAKRRQNASSENTPKVARVTRSKNGTGQAPLLVETPPVSLPRSSQLSTELSFRFLTRTLM